MKPPKTIPELVWRRMPLAKQRLFLEGPTTSGHNGLISAVTTLAFELRLHGMSLEEVATALQDIPFTPGTTPEWRARKQIPAVVAWAFGEPQRLSGCPQTSSGYSKMRDSFADYCDATCRASCKLRQSVLAPEALVADSEYRHVLESLVWMSGRQSGLGEGPRRVWIILASMTVLQQTEQLTVSTAYLTHCMRGSIPYSTLARHLKTLRDIGLVEYLGKGRYRLPCLARAEVEKLEKKLGCDYEARWNRIAANYNSLKKAEEWPTWDAFVEVYGEQG